MLAGLTMCMLIGDSSHHWLDSGLMRAMNVLIGAAIAIAAAKTPAPALHPDVALHACRQPHRLRQNDC